MKALRILACGLGLAVALGGASAHGAEKYYQSWHVGERAAGLAGAYTALAEEAGGVFYNPAGMADARPGDTFGMAVSAYQLDLRQLDDAVSIGSAQGSLRALEVNNYSTSFAYVRRLPTQRRQAVGFSVLVPDWDEVIGKVSLEGASLPDLDVVDGFTNFRDVDRSIWFGLSYALALHPKVAVGASLFYLLRNFQLLRSTVVQGRTEGVFTSFTRYDRLEGFHGSLLLDLGIKVRATRHLRLGLSYRSPNLRIHRTGTGYNNTTGSLGPLVASGPAVEVELNEPFRLSLGIAWEVPRRWTLALDLRFHGRVSPYEAFLRRTPDGAVVPDPGFGLPAERKPVFNVSLGGEVFLRKKLVLRGGFYTNFTAVPDLRPELGRASFERIHLWGLAAGVGFLGKTTTFSLTLNYAFGFGDSLGTRNGLTPAETTVISPASRHVLTVIVGGGFSL